MLGRYVNDGRFCIDKKLVENAVRTLAWGRKSFLFCGNHDAAVVYSLVSSCKAMGGDPSEWMEDVLVRMPGNENNRDLLRGLLPGKWGKEDQVKSIFANLPNFDQILRTLQSWQKFEANKQVVVYRLTMRVED